jgi:hypothetical protein
MYFPSHLVDPKRIRNYSSVSTVFSNKLDVKKTMGIIKAMVTTAFAMVYPKVKVVKWEKI